MIQFCPGRLELIACLLLAVALLVASVWQTLRLSGSQGRLVACQQQVAQAQKDSGRLEAESASLRRDLATQSEAVRAWQREASAQFVRARDAGQQAAEIRTVTRTRVVQVMREATVPDGCDGALQWGAAQARQLGQAWEAGQ